MQFGITSRQVEGIRRRHGLIRKRRKEDQFGSHRNQTVQIRTVEKRKRCVAGDCDAIMLKQSIRNMRIGVGERDRTRQPGVATFIEQSGELIEYEGQAHEFLCLH